MELGNTCDVLRAVGSPKMSDDIKVIPPNSKGIGGLSGHQQGWFIYNSCFQVLLWHLLRFGWGSKWKPYGTRDFNICLVLPSHDQWEFQDPKMEVLYHILPYFGGIFPYIGLT